jgi:hypothetical protein
MKNFKMVVWVAVLSLLSVTGSAQRGSGGWCSNNNYSRLFNAGTIEELKGKVVSVEKIIPETGMSRGIHLIMKTPNNKRISVHLGPEWYLDKQDIHFVAGDVIVVKGSRVSYRNAPAIIAMTVWKGENYLNLRDNKGYPNWNGWRQGKRGRGNRVMN